MSDEAIPEGLTPANQNPWYVLMTLYGEQEGDEINRELAEKNREAWNAWVGQALSEEQKEAAAKSSEIDIAELSAWEDRAEELTGRFEKNWRERNDAEAPPGLPAPTGDIDMRQTAFSNTVVLEKAVLTVAWFNRATFSSVASFDRATFSSRAWFIGATFSSDAWFNRATFSSVASFDRAIFSSAARFNRATFSSDASFNRTTFSSDASFDGTTFSSHAWFDGATFSSDAWFYGAIFSAYAYFTGVRFGVRGDHKSCQAIFRDSQFEKPASFRDAQFATHYPDLTGRGLHENTEITAERTNWPALPSAAPWQAEFWRSGPQSAKEARDSCAALRHLVSKQGLPEDEHFFFRREMHYAGRTGPIFARIPYWAFWALSDYGHGILRPLIWLAAIWAGMVYLLMGQTPPDYCPPAWQHALSNLVNFLGYLRLYYPGCAVSLSPELKAWSGAQTFASYLLLFFLGLGLRQRFRLR